MFMKKELLFIVFTLIVLVEPRSLDDIDGTRLANEKDSAGRTSDQTRELVNGGNGGNSNICPKPKLRNGKVKMRGKGRVAKFVCFVNFEMVGKRYSTCVRGHWTNGPPVCVSRGCSNIDPPNNGQKMEAYKGAFIHFECDPGYVLYGSFALYCDGFRWNGTQPSCKPATKDPATFCDFETEDLCGWSHDPTHDFDWTRNAFATPSGHVGTGPSRDHTKGEGSDGFYMYIEASSPRKENDTARLLSPVYPSVYSNGTCFSFWYHMYGATTGFLRVFIKPESKSITDMIPAFYKAGNQGNRWIMGSFPLTSMGENFQIVIEGIRGVSYISDIAIDDVKLGNMTDCMVNEDLSSTPFPVSIPSSMSGTCHERCGFDNPEMEVCQCNVGCAESHTCCSDYEALCVAPDGNTSNISISSSAPQSDVTLLDMTSSFVISTTIIRNSSEEMKSTLKFTPETSLSSFSSSELTSSIITQELVSYSNFLTKTIAVEILSTVSPPVVASSSFEELSSSSGFISSSVLPFHDLSSYLKPSSVITSKVILRPTVGPFLSSPKLMHAVSSSILPIKPSSSVLTTSSKIQTVSPSVTDSKSTVVTVVKPKNSTLTVLKNTNPTTSRPTIKTLPDVSQTTKITQTIKPSRTTATIKVPSAPSSPSVFNKTTQATSRIFTTWTWIPRGKTTKTTPRPRTNENEIIKSDSLKGTSSTPMTAGIVIASILIIAFLATVIFIVYKRRKSKQDMLADDSDIRYLKDGEIQMEFGDGSRIYDDAI